MTEIWLLHKSKIIGVIIALGVAVFIIWSQTTPSKEEEEVAPMTYLLDEAQQEEKESEENLDETKQPTTEIMIDVKGAVKNPGVFQMKQGERVVDAVERAGGFLLEADTDLVNLAAVLTDEMVLYVPKIGEENPIIHEKKSSDTNSGKININTASEGELVTLSGIGPAKAKAIIEYREKHGFFKDIEDLVNVTGIGQKSLESIQEEITVTD
ncbi:ComE operon protein 1 [Bacillus sp. THAF10]|uniref:helix-hairpin-helix domain-containing protein n=1 Tax=Bacillus sp. THAF10 TaxID=2587848 RepID=UPI0012A91841|nr:helix-hairpin-helix domain-containing protein [Bacillus sp. THAF10]QFT89925.1 ComE operon protein 1 [Bacillus sp. THAF10]